MDDETGERAESAEFDSAAEEKGAQKGWRNSWRGLGAGQAIR